MPHALCDHVERRRPCGVALDAVPNLMVEYINKGFLNEIILATVCITGFGIVLFLLCFKEKNHGSEEQLVSASYMVVFRSEINSVLPQHHFSHILSIG
jgi:hypothetical protein